MKLTKLEKAKIVNEALSDIDFVKLEKVMDFLNWTWFSAKDKSTNVPSKNELFLKARELCYEALKYKEEDKNFTSIGSGGFEVRVNYYSRYKEVVLKLTFALEGSETFYVKP